VLAARRSLPALAAIGLAAGFFAALFGVGGGLIVVPFLMFLLGFDPRKATGTSLLGIAFTAAFGAVGFALLGDIHWAYVAIVGLPAVVGTIAGVWIQQRLSSRIHVVLFACLLVGIAIRLLVE
jgi:uncharacterized membrane protein YfcA